MNLADIFALVVAAITLGFASMVVLSKNPLYAAIFLLLTLLGVAVEYVILQAHFLAVIQILVYAGAIVVLILFVLMMMGFGREGYQGIVPPRIFAFFSISALLIFATAGGLSLSSDTLASFRTAKATPAESRFQAALNNLRAVQPVRIPPLHSQASPPSACSLPPCPPSLQPSKPATQDTFGTPHSTGRFLIVDHVLAFEIISILLLMAILGVVVILREHRPLSKG